jgi:hypothetical protein
MNQLTNYKYRVRPVVAPGRTWTPSRYESFTQNKPNLLDTQMNIGSVETKYYENSRLHRCDQNKPNQTQLTLCKRIYKNGKYVRVRQIPMHRWLMKAPRNKLVDHRDHNGLDNRRTNLRLATPRENAQNRRAMLTSRLGLKGVYRHKDRDVFEAAIRHKGKQFYLGRFKRKDDAARAYDKKARELFGEFAYLNFPEKTSRSTAGA